MLALEEDVVNYYNLKLYLSHINIKDFLNELKLALLNNLPIVTVKVKFSKFQKDNRLVKDYLKQDEVDKAYDSFCFIINYLEKKKYLMETKRKIEIFRIWLYFVAISYDFEIYFKNISNSKAKLKIYSFRTLIQIIRSVMYELDDLNCCFNHNEVSFKENKQKETIFEDMITQPDILTRAICSNLIDNVKLLFENGYRVNQRIKYNHSMLKTPLYWAYYLDNVEIFNYLVNCGFEINDHDIFYDFNFKKSFKFSLYLYFLKENTKQNSVSIRDLVKFDDTRYLVEFDFYKSFKDYEIIQIYEKMFSFGFSLKALTEYINIYDVHYYYSNGCYLNPKDFEFNQLQFCVAQNGINSTIIKYLIDKFAQETDFETQYELADVIKHSAISHLSHYKQLDNEGLEIIYLNNILTSLYPLLNENTTAYLNKILNNAKFDLVDKLNENFTPSMAKHVEKSKNYEKCLYYRNSFKALDFFVNYGFCDEKLCLRIIDSLTFWCRNDDFEELLQVLTQLIFYLLENQFINRRNLIEYYEKNVWPDFSRAYYRLPDNNFRVLKKSIMKVIKFCSSHIESLFDLARYSIRNSIKVKSAENIKKLNLPQALEYYILNSTKRNKGEFYELFKNYDS